METAGGRRPPYAFRYGDQDRFPLIDTARPPGRGRAGRRRPLGLVVGTHDSAGSRGRGRRDRARDRPRDDPRQDDRHPPGRRSRRTSPSCFDRAKATASSSRRSNGAACRPTCTRGSASSTRTRSRTRGVASLSGGADLQSARRSVSPLAADPAVRPRRACPRARSRRRLSIGDGRRRAAIARRKKTGWCWRRRGHPRHGGWRSSIGSRPPSFSTSCFASRRTTSRSAGPRRRAGAGEPEEAARPDPPDSESRIRDAGADCRSPRTAGGRRRIECRHRRGRRGQPDDGPRGERSGVSRSSSS